MTLASSSKIIPVIVTTSVVLITLISVAFAQAQIARANSDIIKSKDLKLDLMGDAVKLRLQDAVKLLKSVANQIEIKNVLYSNLVSQELKGIPPDADPGKRQVAKNTLSVYQDFDTVAFLLPNGDVYLVEPYESQQNLPRLNFAFREYYQGVISNGDTYIGEAVVSAATGHRVVPIAVAVYSDNATSSTSRMTGILVGALNVNTIANDLREDSLGNNEVILITDHKGSVVAESTDTGKTSNTLRSLLYVSDVNEALNGHSGYTTQMLDGVDTLINYRSIPSGSNNWAAVSMQPQSDSFFAVNSIRTQSILTVILVLAVSSTSGYFLFRSFKGNSSLTSRLGVLNENLKQQAAQLRQLDREKEEFSAMITHELKTPLVPVIGYSELLLDGTLGDLTEKQKQKMRTIHDSASSLSRLISDLLDARKLELGKLKLFVSNCSIKEIIEHCLDGLALAAQSKGVSILYSLSDNTLTVDCDSKRIEQVLYNLLTNALKFVPAQTGKIEIRADKTFDSSILFSIRDNGVGIPKEKQQNLFKKFYQADTSLTRNVGGTGLGLAISKGIIEAHKGQIWFESEEGKGSTFSFIIPVSSRIDGAGAEAAPINKVNQVRTAAAKDEQAN